ncbi:PDZ domain-containing protein [Nesterenkonia halophila]|uniref:YlbL family protein n=1 Tax=Nesterenkonia halophila TaxID=302044 RepID=UPI001FEA05DE|nr:S16 family serine protease [Nesterenkonia halophila]
MTDQHQSPRAAQPAPPAQDPGLAPASAAPGSESSDDRPAVSVPGPPRRRRLRRGVQLGAGASALLLGAASLSVPSAFLIESPGPTFNTIGETDGDPIITVDGAQTYETDGNLDLTTVYVNGQPTSTVRVPDMIRGWFDPSVDVEPHELVYPSGTSAEEVEQQNAQAMTSSQDQAVAAALDELGIEYSQRLEVVEFTDGAAVSGADDVLQIGDEVVAAAGERVAGVPGLRDAVTDAAGQPVGLDVIRDGERQEVDVPTYEESDGQHYMGVLLQGRFEFPVEVDIRLDDVGGPSAGMMFSLGVIDTLTDGSMTAGEHWAGTGTVEADGTVGPIGGIAQKVRGAAAEGADHFLAPAGNCAGLDGRVPAGIDVYSIEDVGQGRSIVQAVGDGDEAALDAAETCG